jgi:hypothetical protein
MSELLRKYLPLSCELFKKHKLTVPERTAEMIAKTIMHCRVLEPRAKKKKGEELSPRKRLKKARTHAAKLLEYTARRPSHAASIFKRSNSLYKALDDWGSLIWLATAASPVNVSDLVDRLQAGGLNNSELTGLVRALDSVLSKDRKDLERTGRPAERLMYVIRGGYIAWHRAGAATSFYWDEASGRLTGLLPEFIRDLISYCDGTNERMQVQLELVWPSRPAVVAILKRLGRGGVRVSAENNSLVLVPKSALADGLRVLIRLHKAAMLDALEFDARLRAELVIKDAALHCAFKLASRFCKDSL